MIIHRVNEKVGLKASQGYRIINRIRFHYTYLQIRVANVTVIKTLTFAYKLQPPPLPCPSPLRRYSISPLYFILNPLEVYISGLIIIRNAASAARYCVPPFARKYDTGTVVLLTVLLITCASILYVSRARKILFFCSFFFYPTVIKYNRCRWNRASGIISQHRSIRRSRSIKCIE